MLLFAREGDAAQIAMSEGRLMREKDVAESYPRPTIPGHEEERSPTARFTILDWDEQTTIRP
jgi:hypothetical protein